MSNSFAKQSLDLIIELRRAFDRRATGRQFSIAPLLLIAALATAVGFYLGRLSL